MSFHDSATVRSRGRRSRRFVLAALAAAPASISGMAPRDVLAQPAAADPVSFYLGQVLALATLQAQAVKRLRPLLAVPATGDSTWLSGAAAEAGVIGAVAAVLSGMEPPPELAASVGELRLASAAYQNAAAATDLAAAGDPAATSTATAALSTGAAHILLWLGALTAETGNDWGDGLRTLTAAELPVAPTESAPVPVEPQEQEVVDVPEAEAAAEEPPTAEAPAEESPEERRARRKAERQK